MKCFCKDIDLKNYIFYLKKILILHPPLSVAQLVEQLTLNQWVTGSNPVGETFFLFQTKNPNHLIISYKSFSLQLKKDD